MTGVVSNLIVNKKYGFISGDNGQEYFFHMLDSPESWGTIVNQFTEKGGNKVKVYFDAAKTPKGPRAKNVSILEA